MEIYESIYNLFEEILLQAPERLRMNLEEYTPSKQVYLSAPGFLLEYFKRAVSFRNYSHGNPSFMIRGQDRIIIKRMNIHTANLIPGYERAITDMVGEIRTQKLLNLATQ